MASQTELNAVIRFRATDTLKANFDKIAAEQDKKGSELLRDIVGTYVQSYRSGTPDMLALRNQQDKKMQDQIANYSHEIENLTGKLEGVNKELAEYVEMADKYIEHSAQYARHIRDLFKIFHEDYDDFESSFWDAGNDSPEIVKGIFDHVARDIKGLRKDFQLRVGLVLDIMNKLQYTDDPYNLPHYIGGVLQGHENLLAEIIRKSHIEGDIPETSEHNALSQVKRLKECQEATHLSMEVATVQRDRTSKILGCICKLFVQTDATLTAMSRRNWWQRLFDKVVEVGKGDTKIAEARYEHEVNAAGSKFDAEYCEASSKKEEEDAKE